MDVKYKELDFQFIIEALPVALVLVDNLGKIVYLNSFTEHVFSYKKNELVGEDVEKLISTRFRSDYSIFMNEYIVLSEKQQWGEKFELFALKKNGEEFPVEIGLNSIVTSDDHYILVSFIDIAERRKASEQFRMVVESSPSSIILVDYKGHIIMINKQTETLFGYTRSELLGERMEILVPERLKAHHPELREKFLMSPESRPMGAGRDLFAVRKDGIEVPVEIGLSPLEKDGKNYVLASIIDITERKKNEEAVSLYTKRLEDKNKELEQFTYIASHDLREPLNSISSLVDLILQYDLDKLDESILKKFHFIAKSSTRMKDLVKGLLDYGRLGRNAEFKKIDINYILDEVLSDLEQLINNSEIEIIVHELPELYVLEMEIRLLFQNLISNAIKYRSKERRARIEISAQKVKKGWEFAIADNGIGIPKDQFDKVFVLFQRLHGRDEYDGIGIGLAHCRKIVELHDGKIWVESELGKGSTFNFFIPQNNIK